MMKSIFALLALLLFSARLSEAVRCWKCDNAQTNDMCINTGRSVECAGEHGGCFAEIRYHIGLFPPILITKRCKQGLACDNNVGQNDKGKHPFQCNPRIPESICRCCCDTEDCNKPDLGCLPSYPDCRRLKVPRNGEMTCKYGTQPPSTGEVCSFTCGDGYELVGEPVLTCEPKNKRKSKWDHKEPVCKPLRCKPPYVNLVNGQVDCTRRNFVFSKCTFKCKNGYRLEGHPTATCDPSQNWSAQPPKCIEITCPPPMIPPTFGTVKCSKENKGGSVCRFKCENGYQLLGNPTSTCKDDNNGDAYGRWTHPVPRCGRLICQPQSSDPTNGRHECTNGNNGGSRCSYTCRAGYAIKGSPSRICQDDGDGDENGKWSDREPTCQRIKCKPARFSPANGQVSCTNQNFEGSVCTYTCDDGFTLTPSEDSVTKCEDDGNGDATGQWSNTPPTCSPGQCEPVMTNPTNGRVLCSKGNEVRSVCRFTCNEGYYMRSAGGSPYPLATTDVTCRRDNQWSQQPPTCEPITCDPPHSDTSDKTVSCTDANNWKSVCTWQCRDGSPISGQITSECKDNGGTRYGKWDPENPVNTCEDVKCQPPQINPQNGEVTCTDGNNVLSECTFMCSVGYYMVTADGQPVRLGEFKIDCKEDATWSESPPQCLPVVCNPKHSNPDNGFVSCTFDNKYSSICSFSCRRGYQLDGNPKSECLDSAPGDSFGDWSHEAPICTPAACSPELVTPLHGTMDCSNGADFNSLCKFTCEKGYYMVSPTEDTVSANQWESLCRADGTWSSREPTCEPIYCLPEQTGPRNGEVSCTDKNNYRSRCTFSCNPGYELSKPKKTTDCLDDGSGDALGKWSDPKPECLPRACSPEQGDPENGVVDCTDGSAFGSICTFRCNKGFYQTAGGSVVRSNDHKTECLSTNTWSQPPAKCSPILCRPPHSNPDNGKVGCTRENRYLSICTFKCDPGYEVDGEPKSTCEDDGNGDENGEWSSPPPTCEASNCKPRLTAPAHGTISCTNKAVFGSECTFQCDEGYYMVSGGKPYTSNDLTSKCGPGRKWTKAPPSCRPITCMPPHRNPSKGKVTCTNKNLYGSRCTFTCNEGFVMKPGRGGSPPEEGTIVSSCLEDRVPGDARGAWTEPAPTCTPDKCEVRTAPKNGRISCSAGNLFGSTCTYICNKGYYMRGPDTRVIKRNVLKTNCLKTLDWSVDAPTCEPITCLPVHEDPEGGSVRCTRENFHQSVCTFKCDRGYAMTGRPKTTCEEGDGGEYGRWSYPAPTCKENLCDPDRPTTPENGRKSCTKSNVLGSVCTFTCDRYHTRRGPASSKCIEGEDGLRWSHPSPTCEPDRCRPPREELRHGTVSCTKTNKVTSVCTFKCTEPGYSLHPPTVNRNRCEPSKLWNNDAPCCTRPCPPNAKMDAFLILDSSSSVGTENWVTMKAFVRGILASFTISDDTTNFAVIRYNKKVDTVNQIKLSDFRNSKTGLLTKFDKLPYDGSGTKTGKAIKYVGETLMTTENGNRPGVQDLVIVITDGKSQDDVKDPSDDLRRKGAIVFCIGIKPPRGNLDEGQLLDIAGDRANLLVAEGGFDGLDEGFALQITNKVCGDPCDN